jgi:hypothetical protein
MYLRHVEGRGKRAGWGVEFYGRVIFLKIIHGNSHGKNEKKIC